MLKTELPDKIRTAASVFACDTGAVPMVEDFVLGAEWLWNYLSELAPEFDFDVCDLAANDWRPHGGFNATFSWWMYMTSVQYPILPFAIGLLFGLLGAHFFWDQCLNVTVPCPTSQ